MEIWKDIKGFEGYQVSNFGRVRSFRPANGIGDLVSVPRPIKAHKDRKGYHRLGIRRNGKAEKFFVHRLVLNAFVGECPNNEEARHLDGNLDNNHVSNLKWGTTLENRWDRINHGNNNHGESHGYAILSENDVFEVKKLLREGITHQSIADIFDVDRSTITKINIGRNWSYLNVG